MCFKRGQAKSTYGTGCFVLYNTGTAVRILNIISTLKPIPQSHCEKLFLINLKIHNEKYMKENIIFRL